VSPCRSLRIRPLKPVPAAADEGWRVSGAGLPAGKDTSWLIECSS
jgi:hypothetical protein